jgi:site-specific DNA-methyltransferase (adenine-specific)
MEITNEDNMALMARYPDKYFDLAIVDPPYGIGADNPTKKPNKVKQKNGTFLNVKSKIYTQKDWDKEQPSPEYFEGLLRVSKNQIIWGVNYFDFNFKGGRIVWDKINGESDQYDCEIAYNSFNCRTDLIRLMWSGMFQGKYCTKNISNANIQNGNKKNNEKRIHPTQKPVKLYEWLLTKYAKEGDKILDTHLGSGSIAIACHNLGFELTACELDKEYYEAAMQRLKIHQMQKRLF